MTLTRKEAKTTRAANLPKWRSLDPVLLLVSLTLSAFGILAVYVAGSEAQQAYAMNQALGFVLGVTGAIPLALIDYRFWQRYLRPIYGLVLLMLLSVIFIGTAAGGAQ
ncbi:MAG TPA: FtsW/RodA/SpoVE family cell cycle protein, partial [Rubrobacteraceae bacterium]|nr:FtsW/RodA/SpoVE family cell cycle protein [Rubrobacteraceae bacterium]